MEIFKVQVHYTDFPATPVCDAMFYERGIWVVPRWKKDLTTGLSRPMRMVRVGQVGLEPSPTAGQKYILRALSLSKAVLEGQAQPDEDGEVLESPDIAVHLSGSAAIH